jgi:RNA polymerase sigma-70 factor (ECF subfamily)
MMIGDKKPPARTVLPRVNDTKDAAMITDTHEDDLALRAKRGDREAFMTLYNLYLNKVYSRVKSRVPVQDVEDVVQDIFVAVIRSLSSFEQRANFGTWLYTIVNRQIADYYRKRSRTIAGRHPMVTLDDAERVADPMVADRDSLDEQAQLQQSLGALPEHYQEIISLRYVDKLAFAEIAQRRGQTLEAAKSLYRRALQALRERIGETQ